MNIRTVSFLTPEDVIDDPMDAEAKRRAKSERARELMKRLHANPEFQKRHAERSRLLMRKINARRYGKPL